MKRSTDYFISKYCSYFSQKDSPKITITEILCSSDNSILEEISKAIRIIQVEDLDVFENILEWDNQGILFDYLKIIKRYHIRKKLLKLSIVEISRQTGVPVSSIKRIEGLHSMASLNNLLKMLRAVDLKVDTKNID